MKKFVHRHAMKRMLCEEWSYAATSQNYQKLGEKSGIDPSVVLSEGTWPR
jgi:hypothetical protein